MIPTGGTLIFGQEQDSVGGSFDAQQVFQGTIGDIRIFDDVRTAAEINDNRFVTLTGNEQGLAHNWQVQAGDTTNITDVAADPAANQTINLTTYLRSSFTASQSSTWSDSATYAASQALDENTGTTSHTGSATTIDQWLQVDFDQAFEISEITLVNRDSNGARLDGAVLSVLDENGNVLHAFDPITGAENGETFTFTLPATITASAIRVDNDDTDYLQIAEIDIFGPVPAGFDPTGLTVHNGGTVHDTAPVIDTTPDNDTLRGEQGNDVLHGGWGDDTLYGHGGDRRMTARLLATTGIALNQNATNQYLEHQ